MTKYVRLTSSPNTVTEVADNEYTDYKRWGLVVEDVTIPDEAPAPTELAVSEKFDTARAEVSTKTATASKRKTTTDS